MKYINNIISICKQCMYFLEENLSCIWVNVQLQKETERESQLVSVSQSWSTCSASQPMCLRWGWVEAEAPRYELMWASVCGSRAAMLVWMAVNQELAVGPSLQRSTTVCWPSGECSSNSLREKYLFKDSKFNAHVWTTCLKITTAFQSRKTSIGCVEPRVCEQHTHWQVLCHLFSRSGMVRFLLMKHIFRLMTFLSLEKEELLCLGEPESSLPL